MPGRSLAEADARLTNFARRHRGAFTRDDANRCGFSPATIWRRVQTGAWRQLQEDVFAHAASPDTPEQRIFGTLLAVGDDAVASHETALALWGLGDVQLRPPFHVSAPHRCEKALQGVELHHLSTLRAVDRVTLNGMPVTAVPRTLLDTSPGRDLPAVEDLVVESHRRRLATPGRVNECLDLVPNAPGSATLRRIMRRFDPDQARQLMSRLETRFLVRVVRRHDLPEPEVNRRLYDGAGLLVAKLDFSWPWALAVVEIDGLRFHSTSRQKAYDDQRQNELVLTGQRVLRYGAQGLDNPELVAAQVRRLLRGAIPARRSSLKG